MLRTKIRFNTCKIVLVTSLVWFLVDILILALYSSDSVTNNISKFQQNPKRTFSLNNASSSPANILSRFEHSALKHEQQQEQNVVEKENNAQEVNEIEDKIVPRSAIFSPTYGPRQLKRWKPMTPVPPQQGKPGELGRGVRLPQHLQATAKEQFKLNQFNIMASDMISLNRSLQDVRQEGCKTKKYPNLLPTTSVVIVFHNEAWSTLLRTVWSVINRSPRPLLKEIILVDDASERDYLGKKLENYVSKLPVLVNVLRTGNRSGLIRARLLGAKHVQGQVITFLDAHCECTEGWLEPLLSRIAENRKNVVCPIIDVISDETFEYVTASDMTWGGFNWKLNFRWYRVPQREMTRRGGDRTTPLHTPTMAGGLFSIDKEYFYEIGAYDDGMDIWGGENLEMSFRVWQCGGTLEIIPCSHVGHVFRDKSPYTFPGGVSNIVLHNAARVAEVWMDEWRDFYYAMNPGAASVNVGDISGRRELRERLKCHSFRWYLENIYPESQMPLEYYYLGEMRNMETQTCLDTMSRKSGEKVGMSYCHGLGGNQVFAYTKRSQIMSDDNCLDAAARGGPVNLIRCHGMGGNQAWVYDDELLTIKHINTDQCLDVPNPKDPTSPTLKDCNGSVGQRWVMKTKFHWQAEKQQ